MRETKEIRKLLFGDTKRAAAYIGLARTLLGQVKRQAEFGNLSQLSRVVNLPDGTRIAVDTRFGQDTVEIRAPFAPRVRATANAVPVRERVQLAGETPRRFIIAGAGWSTDDDSTYWGNSGPALLWRTADIPGADPLVIPDSVTRGGPHNTAMASCLSRNGRVVGGMTIDVGGRTDAFIWTISGGVDVIAAPDWLSPYEGLPNVNVMGISADGNTAAVFGCDPIGGSSFNWGVPFVWKRGEGLSQLEIPPGFLGGTVVGISGDGQTLVGFITEDVYARWDIYPVTWHPNGAITRMAGLPGAVLCASYDGGTLGGGTYTDVNKPTLWRGTAGTRFDLDPAYLGGAGALQGMSDDGRKCAAFAPATPVSWYGYMVNHMFQEAYYQTGNSRFPNALYSWDVSHARARRLGMGTMFGISHDGAVIVGMQTTEARQSDGNRMGTPTYWLQDGIPHTLPTMGSYNGMAAAVAVIDGSEWSIDVELGV